MSHSPDRLYDLLPAIYRLRDAEQGYPLKALLRVITEQVDLVEDNIGQTYENWFIETCEDWVVPYLGALVGYKPVHDAGEPSSAAGLRELQRNKILIPRAAVANTIPYRRRKGTLALLELLANDVAGWPARAVEFYKLLGWTQNLNHLRPLRGRTADLRNENALDLIDTPFDQLAHSVDVRRIISHRTQGRYNIPSAGLFVWRLKSYPVTHSQACCVESLAPHCYTFSILGNDTQLYNRPQRETDPSHIAEELNLPTPIRRLAFEEEAPNTDRKQASSSYYGVGKSLAIWAPDWPKKGKGSPIDREAIIPADLSDWRYRAPRNFVAVDPVRGRIVFPPGQLPKHHVRVSYQYAFSADMGGGEYDRRLQQPADHRLYRVGRNGDYETIRAALHQWEREQPKPLSAVVEILESSAFTEPLHITLGKNEYLQIRGANRTRPVIRMLDYMADRPDAFRIRGEAGSRLVLDGLLIAGRGLQVQGPDTEPNGSTAKQEDLCQLTIRHCTLVPGWTLGCDCEPEKPNEPSLGLINTAARINIEHSILGSILVEEDEMRSDPVCIQISDSILDATATERVLLGAETRPVAFADLSIARSTVIGQIQSHSIRLAENCIFLGMIRVARRQQGCIRFCYVTPESRTPRKYHCQPDLVEQAAHDPEARQRERLRVRPEINSLRYGTPDYCQLADTCAEEIVRGAEDESEMGAFHDLYQPQRSANLRAELVEYTPAGMDTGIIHAS
jgi:hypothetical protein